MPSLIHIPYKTLCDKIHERFIEAGMPAAIARTEAEILAEADLCGVPSHGVRMIPGLLKAIADGRVNATAQLHTELEFGATCTINCNNGPGRHFAVQGMHKAVQLAKQFGVGVCLAKNTSHWGRAHAYAYRAALEDCIGLCTTNAVPTMAIAGAKTRVIGNNPLAIGIPGNNPAEPIVLDMAMSQAAVGKVITWLREGHAVPDDWGLDKEGNPSSDAASILEGAVTPMGKHKGAGLAVMFELMTAALAGAAFSHQIQANDPSGIDPLASKIFIAINIAAFGASDAFKIKTTELKNYLTEVASPFQYPGERGWQEKNQNLKQGVPIHKDIVAELNAAGLNL